MAHRSVPSSAPSIGVTVNQTLYLGAGDNVTLVAFQTTAYPYIYGSTHLTAYRLGSA